MKKIIFKDLPSTETPIDATNLNAIQDNAEEAINGVIESGSNENGSWVKFSDGTIIMRGTKKFGNDGTFASSFATVNLPITINVNKDYTFYASPVYYSDFDGANSVILTPSTGNDDITAGKNSEVVYRRLSYYPAGDSRQTELFAHSTKFNWLAIGRWK